MKSKERKIKDIVSGFAFQMITGITIWFLLFTLLVSAIGYIRFTKSLTEEYNDSAFRTAESAAMILDGNKIDEYLDVEKGNKANDGRFFDKGNKFVAESRQNVFEGLR